MRQPCASRALPRVNKHEVISLDDWSRPLGGLQVLDLSLGTAAGFCARLFAQLGAEVHRLPGPADVDAPLEVAGGSEELRRRVARYVHAGKRVLADTPPRNLLSAIQGFLGTSDLIIEDRGKEFVAQLLNGTRGGRPRVVSVSDYGWDGPYASWRADTLTLQSHAGITALTGSLTREPLALPTLAIYYVSGAFAFIAGMAMLYGADKRERHVLVTSLEAASTLHQFTYLAFTRLRDVRKRGHFMFPSAIYMSCLDGDILLAPVKHSQWAALVLLCGKPEMIDQTAFQTFLSRQLNLPLINRALGPWFAERKALDAFEALGAVGVPAAVIQTPQQALHDPQFAYRNFTLGEGGFPVPFLVNGLRPRPEGTESE